MNPISNQQYSRDSEKYIYQDSPNPLVVNQGPAKPFKVSSPHKSEKAKKDVKKGKKSDGKISPYDLMSE